MIKEKIEKRANLVAQARELVDIADKEKRAMSAEENEQYDKMLADVEKLSEEIDKETKLLEIEQRLSKPINSDKLEMIKGIEGQGSNDNKEFRVVAFRKFLIPYYRMLS